MPAAWDERLGRWVEAGLLEPAAAERIRVWEAAQAPRGPGWPVRLALGFGGLLLCAGVLLFVAAHWDALAPTTRFALLIGTVAAFHLAGALTARQSAALPTVLHACGTAALGGGIFLAGQIFHLSEHWPSGVLLWSVGAWAGWLLLRDWPHTLFAAVLTPAWLVGEWTAASTTRAGGPVLGIGLVLTALAYLSALAGRGRVISAPRATLVWIGGLALIPAAVALVASARGDRYFPHDIERSVMLAGWIAGVGLPLVVAWWLRRGVSLPLLSLAGWTVAGPYLAGLGGAAPFLWAGSFGLGLVSWGVIERRAERINLGIAGFAISVLSFYFSSVMDRLGRSVSLVGLGLLFLVGGWVMEQGRRRLVARVARTGR